MGTYQIPTAIKSSEIRPLTEKILSLLRDEKPNLKPETAEVIKRAVLIATLSRRAESFSASGLKKYFLKIASRAKHLLAISQSAYRRRRPSLDKKFHLLDVRPKDLGSVSGYEAALSDQIQRYEWHAKTISIHRGPNERHRPIKKFISLLVEARSLNGLGNTMTHHTAVSRTYQEGSYSGQAFEFFQKSVDVVKYKIPQQTLGSLIYCAATNQK